MKKETQIKILKWELGIIAFFAVLSLCLGRFWWIP